MKILFTFLIAAITIVTSFGQCKFYEKEIDEFTDSPSMNTYKVNSAKFGSKGFDFYIMNEGAQTYLHCTFLMLVEDGLRQGEKFVWINLGGEKLTFYVDKVSARKSLLVKDIFEVTATFEVTPEQLDQMNSSYHKARLYSYIGDFTYQMNSKKNMNVFQDGLNCYKRDHQKHFGRGEAVRIKID